MTLNGTSSGHRDSGDQHDLGSDVSLDATFDELVSCAQEIVLPGTLGVRVPAQRRGAWYDVSGDAVLMTDGVAGYGSV